MVDGNIGRDFSLGRKEGGGGEKIMQVLHLGRLQGEGGEAVASRDF